MRKLDLKTFIKHIDSLGSKGVEKLAIKTDLSASYLDKLKRGVITNPTLETINKLCLATELSFDELFPFVDGEGKAA